jgi:hypothetical protein
MPLKKPTYSYENDPEDTVGFYHGQTVIKHFRGSNSMRSPQATASYIGFDEMIYINLAPFGFLTLALLECPYNQ